MSYTFAPIGVKGADIGDWIAPQHRTFLALNLTQSITTAKERDGYLLLDDYSNDQIAVWRKGASWVIGCRATGIGKLGIFQDIGDDKVLSGADNRPVCDLNITNNARKVIDSLMSNNIDFPKQPVPFQVWVVGYSLGGAAAMCIGEIYPWIHVLSFAGGAPATRPHLHGPGPARATHYHVVGDLVSTHMSPLAAHIVRVNKKLEFGVFLPHISGRFLKGDPSYGFWTADQEDEAFLEWASQNAKGKSVLNVVRNIFTEETTRIACESPIPGAKRKRIEPDMPRKRQKIEHNV